MQFVLHTTHRYLKKRSIILLHLDVVIYIIKRLLWFLPILASIIVLLFLLDEKTRLDQVYQEGNAVSNDQIAPSDQDAILHQMAIEKGWNLPSFYFSFHPLGWSDDFYRQYSFREQKVLRKIAPLSPTPVVTRQFYNEIRRIGNAIGSKKEQSSSARTLLRLVENADIKRLTDWVLVEENREELYIDVEPLVGIINSIKSNRSIGQALPTWRWHGLTNRFHNFIFSRFLSGEMKSVVDGIPIFKKIFPAMGITLFINLVALIVLLLLGIPLGMHLYEKPDSWTAKVLRVILYVLFAIPLFWLATLILMLAGALPGSVLTGIPQLHPGEVPSISTFLRPQNIGYLILPILTIVLSVSVQIGIHMYRALRETGQKKFILAAHSRGLRNSYVTRKYNRPVAIFSIVTIVGNSIPALISGSVVIEIIFNIPGMGRLLWNALYDFDWSLVMGLLLVGVLFSIIGQLLTDVAYYHFNPELNKAS